MDFAEGNGACSMADSPDQGQETAKQVASKFQVPDKGCGRRWQSNVAALHVSFLYLSLFLSPSFSLLLWFLECFYEQLCILCQYFCILQRVLFVQSPDEHD